VPVVRSAYGRPIHPTRTVGSDRDDGHIVRALEAAIAAAALLALSPLLLLIALAVVVEDGGGPVFRQWRIGQHGRPFRILKFRTMSRRIATHAPGPPLLQDVHDPRLTRLGRLLRRTHLDELPQLLNVLRGDMGLIGPRPLIPSEDAQVTRLWAERHRYRPGLTGAWQVYRSYPTSVQELVRLDSACIGERSLQRDIWLLMATARCVLARTGH
jgi:lipopolysaccharide/colanic/teichoic acid biosynthesis glycosyltransferase